MANDVRHNVCMCSKLFLDPSTQLNRVGNKRLLEVTTPYRYALNHEVKPRFSQDVPGFRRLRRFKDSVVIQVFLKKSKFMC